MEACDFKRLVKEKFDARTTYDEGAERHPKLAAELVRRTQLQDGWKVLDLACGTGLVTYMASKFVGSDGFVEGVDISPSMIRQVQLALLVSIHSLVCVATTSMGAGCSEVGGKHLFKRVVSSWRP